MQAGSTYAALVGAVITQLRGDLKISQAELANTVGISQPAWSRIEKGESALTIDQLARAAKKLGAQPSEILNTAEKTIAEMKQQGLEVSYEKPRRSTEKENSNTGLLLLGGAALAALIYAAKNK